MCKMHSATLLMAIALLAAGCGKQSGTDHPSTTPQGSETAANGQPATAVAKAPGPAEVVAEFLEAVRTANDENAMRLLSTVARQKAASLKRDVTPPASDTAEFTIGKVDFIGHDGARVASTWTDKDSDGQLKTDEAIWVLRREPKGWRVCGVAAIIFPGEPPLLLNFEDPEDIDRKHKWVMEEIRRRSEKEEAGFQAQQGGEKPENPIRR